MNSDEQDLDSMPEEPVVHGEASALSNAPWWLISAGLHMVLLLGAALIYVDRLIAADEGEVVVVMGQANRAVIDNLERPRDLFERKGIPKDDHATQPTEEPAIFFPEAKESDHNESADQEDYKQMKGDSKDFLSYIKGGGTDGFRGRQQGKSAGVYDTMGVGGGAGSSGRYGGRFGGRENLVARGGGTRATESAVLAALKWLARHQNADGSWGSSFSSQCVGARCSGPGESDFDAGVTGLSILAFLGAGYTHLSRDEFPDPVTPGRVLRFGEVVKKGVQWLIAHQDPEGCLGERTPKYMYNHTVAALSLTEAYGMTGAQLLKDPAQKAVDFLVSAQNPGKAWRYAAKCGDNDTSVTGWGVMVLKSAELSELVFPRTAYDSSLNWLNEVTAPAGYFEVGYNAQGYQRTYIPGKTESFVGNPAMAAVSGMCRIFIKKDKDNQTKGAAQQLLTSLPEWTKDKIDYYYWYYASLALFQFDGPDGAYWSKWNEPMKNALVPNQKTVKDSCQNGSWDTEVDRWSCEGGRVYATAINALTLEVYYRYGSVFGGGKKK